MSGVKFTALPLIWRPSDIGFEPRLREILLSWQNTPYMSGQQQKGVGVDCVRFVTAVLDELIGRETLPIERLPRDASLNDGARSREFMRLLLSRYAPVEPVKGNVVEPGDMLVVGANGGGPGHVIFVGTERNTTWQAGSRQVIKSGWALADRFQILAHVYRFGERNRWLKK